MAPTEPFKVAAVEFNPEIFEFDRNLTRAVSTIKEAAGNGARLIVLPEAALSGYIYRDLEQFLPYMTPVPGPATDAIAEVTRANNCYVAIGIAEVDPKTGLTYNTGALIGPDGYIGKYRKNGLNPSDILWFMPGNTGYPVFDTELGSICMVICYDDTYWEPARLPALKGADIVAYICSSDRVLPELSESGGNHSTIAAVEQLSAWNGLAMVAADRNNAETNPTTGVTVTYGGSASIWQADGKRVAHAPATNAETTAAESGTILYADLDPSLFDNDQKATISRRRPELYRDLAFYKAPVDTVASTEGIEVRATALQYRSVFGEFDDNLRNAAAVFTDLETVRENENLPGLVVLPAFSFSGQPTTRAQAEAVAEGPNGRTVQAASDFAVRAASFLVASHVERDGDDLYHCAVLLSPHGKVVGSYRQCHLDSGMDEWASEGDDLSVFDTDIGRIGLLLCQDVRFPEASGVLAVRRADLIAIPTRWDGGYGGHLHDAGGLFAHQYPENTMNHWYAVAKTSQAYTVVANPVNDGYLGSSGIFTINPVDSVKPLTIGSVDTSEVVSTTLATLGEPGAWLNQHQLIGGRRVDLVVPAILAPDSIEFTTWKNRAGYDCSPWTSYTLD
jgi:predicted amidohydrolase